jgi:hypothetical protein
MHAKFFKFPFRIHLPWLVAVCFLSSGLVANGAMIISTATRNGHTYHLVGNNQNTRIGWLDAEAYAKTLGGNLVTINDSAENDFVLQTFGATAIGLRPSGDTGLVSLWIGFNDYDTEETWKWVSGETPTYTNWFTGEPAGGSPDEDFAAIIASSEFGKLGKWHDVVGDFRFNDFTFGVVEVANAVPEPTSVVLCGLGAAGMGLFARRKKKRSV